MTRLKVVAPVLIVLAFSIKLLSGSIASADLIYTGKTKARKTNTVKTSSRKTSSKKESRVKQVNGVFNQNDEWVESTLSKMTIEEKIGQMIMPWAEARFMNEDDPQYKRLVHLVKDLKTGGIIFFDGDVLNQALLTNKLQQLSAVPLLIASDFERGLGMRLKDAVEFPYNMAIGAADDSLLTYYMGRVVAIEAKKMGVHQNYAPLVDLNGDAANPIINIRAYSEDKQIANRNSAAFIKGSNEEKVLTTAKHFPGHGGTSLDSHKDLPLITHNKKEFESQDLIPFKKSIEAGVKSVMVGHLEVPAYEPTPGVPATLSQSIVTDLLQKQLGFEGLIVTDAMNMQGVTKNYKPGEAAVKAVKAGNDMVLFPPDEDAAFNGLLEAVKSGELSVERIDQSVRKILAAKSWVEAGKYRYVDYDSVIHVLKRKSHMRLAQDIADESITMLKNEGNVIPVDTSKYYSTAAIFLSDDDLPGPFAFEEMAKNKFMNFRSSILGKKSSSEDYINAFTSAESSDLVLVGIYTKLRAFSGTLELPAEHIDLIKKLAQLKKPVVFMNFGSPYLLTNFPEIPNYLLSYGDPFVSQAAMLKAVTGEIDIRGKLPISIPKTPFTIGSGITLNKYRLTQNKLDEDPLYDFSAVDSVMEAGVHDTVFPGGVLLVGQRGKVIYSKAYGHYTLEPGAQPMTMDAIFDLASVSKVIATTTAAMILYDEGKIVLDKKVAEYLPEFANHGKENITVRNLLLHNSGLPAFKPFYKLYKTKDEVLHAIMESELDFPIGSKFLYSDLGMITVQRIIEKVTGKTLDTFLKERVFEPLNMKNTMYNPPPELWYYTVNTENDRYWRMMNLKGKVHDETAFMLNGVAGHAGLFSTAGDLSTFLQMLVQKGRYEDKQFISPATVEIWTTQQSEQSSRGLGWDTKSPTGSSCGSLFSLNSFGHTGYTGTSVWVDKDRGLFVILLTNRVQPTRDNTKIIRFRPRLHDAIERATEYL